jgi:hypothetical protein
MKATLCFGAWGKEGRFFNSTQILCLLLLVAGFSANTNAQDVAALDKAYHPGEQVHVIVTFAAPVELSGGGVGFSLTKLDDEAQRLWTRGFNLMQLKRLQPNQYEATGPVPEYAASGAYRLIRAWSGVSDLSKNYDYPDTLHQDITIRVINEKRDPLPALKEIKLVK